jgi:glycosyltransferase involved in cell wall biosynthesis
VTKTEKQVRIVTYTTLYPNAAQPTHGVFVENRLRQLMASGETACRVVAPVPFFPFTSPRFGRYADFARAPVWEERHGLTLHHPRYPLIPKIGMHVAPSLLATATLPAVKAAIEALGGADLIDAHYLYPDGVAATMIGRRLGVPVVMTARGNDVSLIPNHPGPKRMILRASQQAAGIITVSAALKDGLIELGANGDRITVLRNGVDLALFRPRVDPPASWSHWPDPDFGRAPDRAQGPSSDHRGYGVSAGIYIADRRPGRRAGQPGSADRAPWRRRPGAPDRRPAA